jgi:thiosulfate/3-mercaptopyruvate sulfurtransferase
MKGSIMNDYTARQALRLTRRQALRLVTVMGAGAALGATPARFAVTHAADPGSAAASGGYARPDALVDVAGLQDLMNDASTVPVGFMPPEEFADGHIPGSVQLNGPELEVIDTSDASIASWHQSVGELLGNLGIGPATTVVVYDNGTLFGARLWWILHYLGHESAHILDGGLAAWQAAGNEVEAGAGSVPGGPVYPGTPRPDRLAQLEEVRRALDHVRYEATVRVNVTASHPEMAAAMRIEPPILIDARTPEEYAEGHIPGSINLNFPLNAGPEPPRFFKPADELQALYDEIGATKSRLVIPYCASGVRSAVTAFTLHLLGYERVALYTGSWLEWSERPDTPKAEGGQP